MNKTAVHVIAVGGAMKNKKNAENKKQSSMAMAVTLIVCGVIAASLVFVLLFSDMVAGRIKMADARKQIAFCSDVLISDPLYEGGKLPSGADALIVGEEAKELVDSFLEATQKLNYQRVISGKAGFWDLSIEFTVDGKRHTVYLREDSLYVA